MNQMSQQLERIDKLKNDVKCLLMDKLNTVDYCELLILIDRFDEFNKGCILSLILNVCNNKYAKYTWRIAKSEPTEYISISQEILDILEGNICTYEIVNPSPSLVERMVWKVYPLRE